MAATVCEHGDHTVYHAQCWISHKFPSLNSLRKIFGFNFEYTRSNVKRIRILSYDFFFLLIFCFLNLSLVNLIRSNFFSFILPQRQHRLTHAATGITTRLYLTQETTEIKCAETNRRREKCTVPTSQRILRRSNVEKKARKTNKSLNECKPKKKKNKRRTRIIVFFFFLLPDKRKTCGGGYFGSDARTITISLRFWTEKKPKKILHFRLGRSRSVYIYFIPKTDNH